MIRTASPDAPGAVDLVRSQVAGQQPVATKYMQGQKITSTVASVEEPSREFNLEVRHFPYAA